MGERVNNPVNGTTWQFLGIGWWVLHIVSILIVAYLGFLFWPR